MKRKRKILGGLVVLLVVLALIFHRPLKYYVQVYSFQKSFQNKLKEAVGREHTLDLRNFNPELWDELVWVGPYENPCENWTTTDKWWINCSGTKNDAVFKLFFLKDAEPQIGFNVLRSDLEMVESGLPKRIARAHAHFKFETFDKYPTLQQFEE